MLFSTLCSAPAQVRAFVADPLCFVGNVRARTANEFLKGFRDVQRKEAQLALPILAMHGTADKITSCLVGPRATPVCWLLPGSLPRSCCRHGVLCSCMHVSRVRIANRNPFFCQSSMPMIMTANCQPQSFLAIFDN